MYEYVLHRCHAGELCDCARIVIWPDRSADFCPPGAGFGEWITRSDAAHLLRSCRRRAVRITQSRYI